MNIKIMKNNTLYALACLLICVLFFKNVHGYSSTKEGGNTPNVIIITFSGVRNAESISDTDHQYMPHLWGDMLKEGALYSNLVNVEQQFHMPSFNAINTGHKFPLWYNVTTPTIFQHVRKKYNWPANKFWMIGHWQNAGLIYEAGGYENTYPDYISLMLEMPKELESKLSQQELALIQSMREDSKKFTGFSYAIWDAFEELFYRLFKKAVLAFHPKLVHYVMGGPETAHYDSFARYALSLKRNDEMVYEIWKMIKTDPFYKDNTFLIVSPDIARDGYYRSHDNNPHDNPSRTWLYVFGPGIEKGISVQRPVFHVDIFPTVARIMGVETPPSEGKVLF